MAETLLLPVDTSMNIGDEELNKFYDEIKVLRKAYRFRKIKRILEMLGIRIKFQ